MLHPTIEELTQGKYNRYELALATAKCARIITDEYVRQHDFAERSQTGNKETDRPINTMIDRELRDEKAVKVAIGRMYAGTYEIDPEAGLKAKEELPPIEVPVAFVRPMDDEEDDEEDEELEDEELDEAEEAEEALDKE